MDRYRSHRERSRGKGIEMKTFFCPFAQFERFESATRSIEQICELLTGKSQQTIRNRVSAGTFPRPTSDGVWPIDDKADNLDAPEMHPMARKPRNYAISVQSIIGAVQMEYASFSIKI